MLYFYDVDPEYAEYLRKFDNKIPNIVYDNNRKFVCGITLTVDNCNFFAPISSNTKPQKTCLLISDTTGHVLSSLVLCSLFQILYLPKRISTRFVKQIRLMLIFLKKNFVSAVLSSMKSLKKLKAFTVSVVILSTSYTRTVVISNS